MTVAPRVDRFDEAAAAVQAEQRAHAPTIELACHRARPFRDDDPETARLWVLEITRFGDLDWTWEGALVAGGFDAGTEGERAWVGEIVGLDEVASRLFVCLQSATRARPTVGELTVRPFDFLEALHRLYHDDDFLDLRDAMATRLGCALGVTAPRAVPLPEAGASQRLAGLWDYDWSVLWGPPGTGKTWSIGEQVAAAIEDRAERVLVVSTTNKATDEVAISIARSLRERGSEPSSAMLRRVGAGADIERLRELGLESILDEADPGLRDELVGRLRAMRRARTPADRARAWWQVQEARRTLASFREDLADGDGRVVVATAFAAMHALVRRMGADDSGRVRAAAPSPFATLIVDEAGLISRAAVAALALWSRRRVLLVGDPQQLSPISKISRVLAPARARWIARSALDHIRVTTPAVRLLRAQFRMHPSIRAVVSDAFYGGRLEDAPGLEQRPVPLGSAVLPESGGRAVWYVLDDDPAIRDRSTLRGERGPAGRSWMRRASLDAVARLLRSCPELRDADGMFVSPFVAQARAAAELLADRGCAQWTASTAHAQQGAQADVVLFDTVHASNTSWSVEEWARIVNVAISRARHLLIVFASRLEMREPYLTKITQRLEPRVLRPGVAAAADGGPVGTSVWLDVPRLAPPHDGSRAQREQDPTGLGAQIDQRRRQRPLLSAEQQRLCQLPIDGKPRLVRGVAGSGKTIVLANWLARRVAEARESEGPYWVVYANRSLAGLVQNAIAGAWRGLGLMSDFPWESVEVLHVLDLLDRLEAEVGVARVEGENLYDFERRAAALLHFAPEPRCAAMFLDEAQDFGDATLALLSSLVMLTAADGDARQRALSIFYDNAQNVYGRRTPRWIDLGLDMRGRSTVLEESYRSTVQITEFALNLLHRLQSPHDDPDHRELLRRRLVERGERGGRPWWSVRFTSVQGPHPLCRRFLQRDDEIRALVQVMSRWVGDDGVRPGDIRVIAHGRSLRQRIVAALRSGLEPLGAKVEERTRERIDREDDTVLVTTAHSFKGHEAEVIAVPGADNFVASTDGGPAQALAAVLYVALTRARSVLYVSGTQPQGGFAAAERARVLAVLNSVAEDQHAAPESAEHCAPAERLLEFAARLGEQHRAWIEQLDARCGLRLGPLCRGDGSVVAEPLFWLVHEGERFACFEDEPSRFVRDQLTALGVRVLAPGGSLRSEE